MEAMTHSKPGLRHRGREPEEKQFDERTIHVDRVARVVKGGRRFRFRALVVIGYHKGRVGIGIAKATDVTGAVNKAVDTAKRNMVKIHIYKGTIAHDTTYKVGGAHIMLKPASAGTGLIAGGVVRTVLEVAGIQNALSKSLGSSNKINIAYATLAALMDVTPKKDWITTHNKAKSEPASASKTAKAKSPTKEAKK